MKMRLRINVMEPILAEAVQDYSPEKRLATAALFDRWAASLRASVPKTRKGLKIEVRNLFVN